jgi:hypothetical protein
MLPSGHVQVVKRQGVYVPAGGVKPAGRAESAAAGKEATVGMHARQLRMAGKGWWRAMASVTTLRFLLACTGP